MTRAEFNDLLENSIPVPYTSPLQVLDKERSIKQYIAYMLNRTNAMFEYENLPDTIPAYMLELYLQIFGSCAFAYIDSTTPINEANDTFKTEPGHYIFYGNLGGERDIYYRPTKFIVANPRLRNSVDCTVIYDKDHLHSFKHPCVVIKSDTNYMGLLPLFSRYAAQLSENDISIRSAQINARAQVGICVSTDRDKETARKYIDDLEAGKIGILGETSFLEGVSVTNVSTQSSNHIIQLIELQQYLKASWYNELGLNVNFNMKREYMSEEEIAVNTDILLPLVDDMYNNRVQAIDLINEEFGLNIKVSKSSAWANKEQEELSALAAEAMNGNVPLKDTITNKIDTDTVESDSNETTVQEGNEAAIPVNSTGSESQAETETGIEQQMGTFEGDGTQSELESDTRSDPTVVINITTQEADVTVQSDTSDGGEADVILDETSEKSEESNGD